MLCTNYIYSNKNPNLMPFSTLILGTKVPQSLFYSCYGRLPSDSPDIVPEGTCLPSRCSETAVCLFAYCVATTILVLFRGICLAMDLYATVCSFSLPILEMWYFSKLFTCLPSFPVFVMPIVSAMVSYAYLCLLYGLRNRNIIIIITN
jgi:hypothetical protein